MNSAESIWTQLNPAKLRWTQLNWFQSPRRVPDSSKLVWDGHYCLKWWVGPKEHKKVKYSPKYQRGLQLEGLCIENARPERRRRKGRCKKTAHVRPSFLTIWSNHFLCLLLYFFNVQFFSISQSYCLFLWSKSYIIHKKYPKLKLSYQVQSHKRSILKNDIKQTFSQF